MGEELTFKYFEQVPRQYFHKPLWLSMVKWGHNALCGVHQIGVTGIRHDNTLGSGRTIVAPGPQGLSL